MNSYFFLSLCAEHLTRRVLPSGIKYQIMDNIVNNCKALHSDTSNFCQLPLLSSMYSQVLVKTCPYARSPPNFPHSEMTAQGAPIGSNFLVRADPSPLAVICSQSMPGAKIPSYKPPYGDKSPVNSILITPEYP